MMKIKRSIQMILATLITAVLIWYIRSNMPLIRRTFSISFLSAFMLIFLALSARGLAGLRIKILVSLFGVKLSFLELYGTAIITSFYNSFMFKGGTILSAAYLKNSHSLDYSKYVSLNIGSTVIMIMSAVLVGLASAMYGYLSGRFDPTLAVVFAFVFAGGVLVVVMPSLRLPRKKVFSVFNAILECWDILRGSRRTVYKLLLLETAVLFTFAARYYIAFRVFSDPIPWFVCFVLAPFNIISTITSVVPEGYGIREVAVGFASKLAGAGFAEGVLATIANRFVLMLCVFVLAPFFSFFLVGKLNLWKKDGEEDHVDR